MKNLLILILIAAIAGCATVKTTSDQNASYAGLEVVQDEMSSQKWQGLQRITPMYPIKAVKSGVSGCTTIEYVITPEYGIENIEVVDASHDSFAQKAILSIKRWKFEDLPAGIISSPIKTQTRFEFCLNDKNDRCALANLQSNTQCSGTDLMTAVGSVMKRVKMR